MIFLHIMFHGMNEGKLINLTFPCVYKTQRHIICVCTIYILILPTLPFYLTKMVTAFPAPCVCLSWITINKLIPQMYSYPPLSKTKNQFYIQIFPLHKLIPTTHHSWGIQIYNNFYDKDSNHSNNLFVQIVSSDPIKVVFFMSKILLYNISQLHFVCIVA